MQNVINYKSLSKYVLIMILMLSLFPNWVFSNTSIITKHPENITVEENADATFTVEATGETLSYIWLYKNTDEDFTWIEVPAWMADGINTSTLTVKNVQAEYMGYSFRCIITGEVTEFSDAAYLYVANGTLTGDAIKIDTVITKQPETITVEANEDAIFKVETSWDDLEYVWCYKEPGEEFKWTVVLDSMGSGIHSNTLTINNVKEEYQGYAFKCIINGCGEETSNIAYLYIINNEQNKDVVLYDELITSQPETITVEKGSNVRFKIETVEEDARFLWLYQNANDDFGWKEVPSEIATGVKTNTLELTNVKEEYNNYAFKCIVYGSEEVISNVAYLFVINNNQNAEVEIEAAKEKYFITEWTIPEDNTTISLPVSGTVDIVVDWGDNNIATIAGNITNANFPTHKYDTAGTYNISIRGTVTNFGLNEALTNDTLSADSPYYTYGKYLTALKQWGEISAKQYGFAYCENLKSVSANATEKTFNEVTNMSYMFYKCTSLENIDLSSINTSKVTNMSNLFNGCTSLTSIDISKFDTTNVSDMSNMFANCSLIESIDLSNLNTANVTNMEGMFQECTNLKGLDLSKFDTAKVENMSYMFNGLERIQSLDISNFYTVSLKGSLAYMFADCTSLESLNIKNLKTEKVTNLEAMFKGCESLVNIDVTEFNTSKVTKMNDMFSGCSSLINLNVNSFDTSLVEDMSNMFKDCSALKYLDLTAFDITKVTNISNFLSGATNLNSILINNKFVVPASNNENVFATDLQKIIVLASKANSDQFANIASQVSDKTFYVSNEGLDSFKTNWVSIDSDNIQPVISLSINDEYIKLKSGFEDKAECTIADYSEYIDYTEYKDYQVYGFRIIKTGTVNTNTAGTYTLTYLLQKTYLKGNETLKETVAIATRNIVVENGHTPTNFVARGEADLTMTITFEKPIADSKVVLQVLNKNGEFETLSEDAPSPFIINNLEESTTYEYRAYAIKDDVQSEYVYTTGSTPAEDMDVVIRHDNIKPIFTFVSLEPTVNYISSEDTLTLVFTATDRTYNVNTSSILESDVIVKVGENECETVVKNITKFESENGETFTLTMSNITGNGEVSVVISAGKVIDKAGNANDERTFNLNVRTLENPITDDAPTVEMDYNIATLTSNQESMFGIVEVIYQYREVGSAEFITADSNIITLPKDDTSYEFRTITKDVEGFEKESKVTTAKTAKMDNSLITITADPTTLTNGDVVVTINYGGSKYTREYSLDNSTWNQVTENEITFTLTENKVVYARFRNNEKVTESIVYEVNYIDKEKPVIGNVTAQPEGNANSKVITVTGVEDKGVAGIKGYYVSNNSDLSLATWTTLTETQFTYQVTENNTYYIWVSDNAGNISEAKTVLVSGIVEKVTTVTVPETVELKVGEEKELEIITDGTPASITYEVANENIVKVEENIRTLKGMLNGETTVKVKVNNYDGTFVEKEIRVLVSVLELTVNVTSNGESYNGEWTKEDVEVTLTVNGTIPETYKEKIGENGEWNIPENIKTNISLDKTVITYNKDFNGNVYYVGNNSNGDIVTTISGAHQIRIDKTKPEAGTANITATDEAITVKVEGAEDVGSGIKEYEINIYLGDELVATEKNVTGEMLFTDYRSRTDYTVTYKVVDNVGNETAVVNAGTITSKEIVRLVTYIAEGQKVQEIRTVAGTPIDLTVTAEKAGYAFKGWAKELGGKVETSITMPEENVTLYAIFKDEETPVINETSYETIDGVLELIVNAQDSGSGITHYAITTDEGTPNEWLSTDIGQSGYARFEVPGTNKYYVWLKDAEGNFTRYEQTAIKDIFAPTGIIEVIGTNVVDDLAYSNIHEVELDITAEDNISIGDEIQIAIYNEEDYMNIKDYSEITWLTSYTEGGVKLDWTTTAGDGLKRIYVIFKDKAGNISMTIKNLEELETAEYKVHYYTEKTDGTGYNLVETLSRAGRVNMDLEISSLVKVISGYNFEKATYTENGTNIGENYRVAEDGTTEIYIYYAKIKVEITLNANGGTIDTPTILRIPGEAYGELPMPTKAGYNFVGWYTVSNEKITTSAIVDINEKVLIANWEATKYEINYILNEGVIEGTYPTSYTIESDDITLINPIKEGYWFIGWTIENETDLHQTITITKGSTGNRTYTAKYRELPNLILSKANEPLLGTGMKAVYWTGSSGTGETINETYPEGSYNYTQGNGIVDTKQSKWANAITVDDGSYWVWIPRYAYKMVYYADSIRTIKTTSKTAYGDVEILFMYENSTTHYRDENGNAVELPEGYKVHPAFQKMTTEADLKTNPLGKWDKELKGIWVAKYEASQEISEDSGTTWAASKASNGGGNNLTKVGSTRVVSKPSRLSWRYIRQSYIYQNSLNMHPMLNSHEMKNSEWGAVAYLTYSSYGRNGNEIAVNQCSSYYTGAGPGKGTSTVYNNTYSYNSSTFGNTYAWNTTQGRLASTTGNIYGVYDMSGGAYEYTAAYLDNGHNNITNIAYGGLLRNSNRLKDKTSI